MWERSRANAIASDTEHCQKQLRTGSSKFWYWLSNPTLSCLISRLNVPTRWRVHAGEPESVHFSSLSYFRTGEYLLERTWAFQAWLHLCWVLATSFHAGGAHCIWQSGEPCPGCWKESAWCIQLLPLYCSERRHLHPLPCPELSSTLDVSYAF